MYIMTFYNKSVLLLFNSYIHFQFFVFGNYIIRIITNFMVSDTDFSDS